MKYLIPALSSFAIVVIVISAAAAKQPIRLVADGQPASKQVNVGCYFPQAPPTIADGSMRIYGCQQIYSEDPLQCCLYVSHEKCALLCNQPNGKEPTAFRGQAVPCPGEDEPGVIPTRDATK